MRYIRREREIQREKEKDGSDVTIVALKLVMKFARLLAKNIGSAEASYIVREVHSVREKEREREKGGSDVTIVALKLVMSFARLLAKNVHLSIDEEFCAIPCQKICTSVSPLLNGAEFTLSVAKTLHFSKQFAFFALSNGVIDRGSKQQSKRWNFRLHRSFSSKYRKNESN